MNNSNNDKSFTDVKKILVRVTNWIGDAVMNTPALGDIRHTYPDAEITVVANPVVANLYSHHPYCDRVIVFDKKGKDRGISGWLSFIKKLRHEDFDLAILLQKAFEAAFMAFCARVPVRIGYRTDTRRFLLTHSLKFTDEIRHLHHVQHYRTLVNHFHIVGGKPTQCLSSTPEEVAWAQKTLIGDNWVVINPGAAYGSAKRWIPESFAQVADRISVKYGANILLVGGGDETEIGQDIEQEMKIKPLNLIGKTSVRELMALISCCRLMVSNDSGPMHVAAAFAVPIVAIFGSTDHTVTYPADTEHRIVRKDIDCAPCLLRQCPLEHQCMTFVTADDVMSAVGSLQSMKPVNE